jgi:hypothetical protein
MEPKLKAENHHIAGFAEGLLAFLNGGEPVKILRLGQAQPVSEEQPLEH